MVVLLDAFDRLCIDGSSAVIGRVSQDIDAEDDVIDVGGRAVGELDVVTHRQVVIDGAVIVLHNLDIAHAIVGIVRAVIVDGLALNAVTDNVAAAVSSQQAALGQVNNFLVISSRCKERAELLAKGGSRVNELVVLGLSRLLFGSLFGSLLRLLLFFLGGRVLFGSRGLVLCGLCAACEQSKNHDQSQKQRDQFGEFLHFIPS